MKKAGRELEMGIEFDDKQIGTTANGYLENQEDWSEGLANIIAEEENIELGEKHWDLINYLRDEYFSNNQSTPNTRTIAKAMADKWGEKIKAKDLYALFPGDPSKQGGRIAGLPESKRKGGY
jgi:tRNA 2-thiouridine synthesizing protein E